MLRYLAFAYCALSACDSENVTAEQYGPSSFNAGSANVLRNAAVQSSPSPKIPGLTTRRAEPQTDFEVDAWTFERLEGSDGYLCRAQATIDGADILIDVFPNLNRVNVSVKPVSSIEGLGEQAVQLEDNRFIFDAHDNRVWATDADWTSQDVRMAADMSTFFEHLTNARQLKLAGMTSAGDVHFVRVDLIGRNDLLRDAEKCVSSIP